MSMDSSEEPDGVSLSEATPSTRMATHFSSSSGIRAPLTFDSDVEYSISTIGPNYSDSMSNYSSDNGFESEEGLASGEDNFETASDMPFVTDSDDETLEETCYVQSNVVYRPFVAHPGDEIMEENVEIDESDVSRGFLTNPDDGTVEGSVYVDESVVPRTFDTEPDEEIVEQSGHLEEDVVSRPFVADTDEETMGEEAEFIARVRPEVVDTSPPKQGMPIAQVSADSDNDSMGSEALEDGEVSTVARIPNAPHKVRISGVEVVEENELQVVVENLSLAEITNGFPSSQEEVDPGVEESIENSNPVDFVDIKGTKGAEEVKAESFIGREEVPEWSGDADKESDLANIVNEETKDLILCGADYAIIQAQEQSSPSVDFKLNLQEVEKGMESEMDDNFGNLEYKNCDGDLDVIIGQDKDGEILESKVEPETVVHEDSFGSSRIVFDGSAIEQNGMSSSDVLEQHAIREGEYNLPTNDENMLEDGLEGKSNMLEPVSLHSFVDPELKLDTKSGQVVDLHILTEEQAGSLDADDDDSEDLMDPIEQTSSEVDKKVALMSTLGAECSENHPHTISQMVTDLDEESEGKEVFDAASLVALLKATTGAGSSGGNVTLASADESRVFSLGHPAGLGSKLHSRRPASQPTQANSNTPLELSSRGDFEEHLNDEDRKKLEKIQQIRVKFLRLLRRLGRNPEDSVAAQVLYRMILAAGMASSREFSLESAKRAAMELEAEGKGDLYFSLNILVIGKTGVGKSATVNSIFGDKKASVNAFEPSTTGIKEIVGTIDGVDVRILDTPGLRSSLTDQCLNQKILSSIKKFTKRYPPDVVLYVDRLDTQTRDLNDLPLLKSITNYLGASIWHNTIVTLTHAASTLPDGPSGYPFSFELFVAQRSHMVQQLISHAVGEFHMMNPGLMAPVALVENHPLCKMNENGQTLLPNGESWRPQLLLLCYSMKILSETSSVVKSQNQLDHEKLFGLRIRSPSLPYFLSSLLHSRAHPKLSTDQVGESVDSDVESVLLDSDQEEEDEYEKLPPFRPLKKSQVAKLSKEQRKAYFDEYDYRVRLVQKKQWREEVKRFKEMKKKGTGGLMDIDQTEDGDQDMDSPTTVAVPLPDMVLPPSFDGDNPAYRYRFLEPNSQFLTRPVLDTHNWDQDCGYDGVSFEGNLTLADRFPAVIAVQMTKDKQEFNIHLDSAVSAKHGENLSTMAGLDVQTIGKQLAYVLKVESKMKNFKVNRTAAGVSVTFLGENVISGLKLEDQIAIGKQLVLVGSTGVIKSKEDGAYGANLEVCVREKDFPVGQDQTTLGLSLVRWRGDLVMGCNLQSQFSLGRNLKLSVRAGLNNKRSGQITVRTSSSDQVQIALLAILPVAKTILRNIFPPSVRNYTIH